MAQLIIPNDVIVQGNLTVTGTLPQYGRGDLKQDDFAEYKIPLTELRVWDAITSGLPATPALDDLGLIDGTFGTGSPSVQTNDLQSAGVTTLRARHQFTLPPEYVAGQSARFRLHAGMLTTLADTSATVDVEAYKSDDEAGIGSDLVTTAATTINSLTLTDIDFNLTTGALVAGDTLDWRISVAINDAASVTPVIGIIGAISAMLDIKG